MKSRSVCVQSAAPCVALVLLFSAVCAQVSSTQASCRQAPDSDVCPDEGVNFYLYTNRNPARKQPLHITDSWATSNVSVSHFNGSNPTKIIIHGYNSGVRLTPLVFMRFRYLRSGPVNVIAVDWEQLSSGPCYLTAVSNTPAVGACLALLISRLREAGANDIHAIGFSLGAHVPNFSAIKLRPYKIPRITGLDPAMPLFAFSSIDGKLDPSDADFVDVFHTNALIQGKMERCGHVDFYFNGAISQPGCGANIGCSHQRAADYFAESIKGKPISPVGFWGWPCPSFTQYVFGMCPKRPDGSKLAGEHCSNLTRGLYLVETRRRPPFAKGAIVEPLTSPRKLCRGTSCTTILPSTASTFLEEPVTPQTTESDFENNSVTPELTTTRAYRLRTLRRRKMFSTTTEAPYTLGIIRVQTVY